jgi:hypothetical protein
MTYAVRRACGGVADCAGGRGGQPSRVLEGSVVQIFQLFQRAYSVVA